MTQAEAFLGGEGDAWFARNNEYVRVSPARELLAGWCMPFRSNISKILEIGAGNGTPLAFLAESLSAAAIGIEPSSKAVANWSSNKSSISGGNRVELKLGEAARLPFEDASFDMVGFGFCLYLVDRNRLFAALSEADRVLKDGGLMYIEDFDVMRPRSNPYAHLEGIYSYKSDYSGMLLASGHYTLVNKYSYAHNQFHFNADEDRRVSMSLLYKQELSVYRPSSC